MKFSMTRWNLDPSYPKPCSPVDKSCHKKIPTSGQCPEILGLQDYSGVPQLREREVYGFRDGFPVETKLDAADVFVANFDIEEDFVCDEGALGGKDKVGEDDEEQKADDVTTRHGCGREVICNVASSPINLNHVHI